MEYELLPVEPAKAGKLHVLKGTIVDTRENDVHTYSTGDSWLVRANVDIDGYGVIEDVNVFYHCQSSVKAGLSDATEGSPFVKGDRVLITNSGDADTLNAGSLKIVGYEDGLPRQCVFQFRITAGGGVVIDESLLSWIWVYQKIESSPGRYEVIGLIHGYHPAADPEDAAYWTKEGDVWFYSRETSPGYITECSYNTVTQIWTVPFLTWPSKTPKRGKDFWASFLGWGGVAVQYATLPGDAPGYIVYREGTWYQEKYKVTAKFYEITIPALP